MHDFGAAFSGFQKGLYAGAEVEGEGRVLKRFDRSPIVDAGVADWSL